MKSPSKKGYTSFNGGSIEHWKVARKKVKAPPSARVVRTASGWRIESKDGGLTKRSNNEWTTRQEADQALERGEC